MSRNIEEVYVVRVTPQPGGTGSIHMSMQPVPITVCCDGKEIHGEIHPGIVAPIPPPEERQRQIEDVNSFIQAKMKEDGTYKRLQELSPEDLNRLDDIVEKD